MVWNLFLQYSVRWFNQVIAKKCDETVGPVDIRFMSIFVHGLTAREMPLHVQGLSILEASGDGPVSLRTHFSYHGQSREQKTGASF